MRIISLDSAKSGDKLASPIYALDGRVILSQGAELNENYISRVKQMGVSLIYIVDDRFDIEYKEAINKDTMAKAYNAYKKMQTAIKTNKDIDVGAIKDATTAIAEDVTKCKIPLPLLYKFNIKEDLLAFHAINTSILCVGMGMALNYNFSQLCNISLAGFIHDIGRKAENDDMNADHVTEGFDILKKYPLLNITATAVTLQHHENFDGSGYPRGIKGDNISEFARIVSIVDQFDTLISEQSGSPSTYAKAFEEVLGNEISKFDPDLVTAFRSVVQVYCDGLEVVMTNGKKGVVIGQNKGRPRRPIIQFFSDELPEYSEEFNMLDDLDITINKVIL